MSIEGLLVASARLIQQNLHLVGEAEKLRKQLIGAYLRPWRWRRVAPLRAELKQILARIEDNSDRIDSLHNEAQKQYEGRDKPPIPYEPYGKFLGG